MQPDQLRDLRCPVSGSALRYEEPGSLVSAEGRRYRVTDGVIDFLGTGTPLTELEAKTQAEYDRVAGGIYDTALDWQFASMYEDEETVRESMIDMLRLAPGQAVLEVGCGTGRDALRLARRLGPNGRLHMQDLSPAMVHACARRMRAFAADTGGIGTLEFSISSATALPFADGVFDAVFHFGGFNQFGDLRHAARELARVTKQGGRIVVGDEAVAPWLKGTEFDAIVTTNNALFKADVPLSALPESARDVEVRWIIGNCFYVIAFSKGEGPPRLNLDLPHQGWRGGTMRSRYYGVLEGVTPEAKQMARDAAARAGVSVHEWLDRLVRNASRTEP